MSTATEAARRKWMSCLKLLVYQLAYVEASSMMRSGENCLSLLSKATSTKHSSLVAGAASVDHQLGGAARSVGCSCGNEKGNLSWLALKGFNEVFFVLPTK